MAACACAVQHVCQAVRGSSRSFDLFSNPTKLAKTKVAERMVQPVV
jgi:hypothetical protein